MFTIDQRYLVNADNDQALALMRLHPPLQRTRHYLRTPHSMALRRMLGIIDTIAYIVGKGLND